jgi:hypothetical protein
VSILENAFWKDIHTYLKNLSDCVTGAKGIGIRNSLEEPVVLVEIAELARVDSISKSNITMDDFIFPMDNIGSASYEALGTHPR